MIGVSIDTLGNHVKFREKYSLKVPLISDEDVSLCENHGMRTKKIYYGNAYMRIECPTFLVDEKGKVTKLWQGSRNRPR